jgi:zinc ribbon protein
MVTGCCISLQLQLPAAGETTGVSSVCRYARSVNACPSCGAPVEADDRFCRRCGTVLDPQDTQAVPLDRGRSQPASTRSEAYDTAVLPVASAPAEPYLAPRSWAPRPSEDEQEDADPRQPSRRRGETPVGALIALLAAAAVVASGFLEWRAEILGGGTAADIPLLFLGNAEATARPGDVTIALVLLALGTAGAIVALLSILVPGLRFLRRIAGSLTLLVPVVFVIRSELALRFLSGEHPFLDSIGRGVWVCAIAAVVEIVAGRWFRR